MSANPELSQLMRDLDRALDDEAAVAADPAQQPLLNLGRRLAADLSHESAIRQSLRRRLLQGAPQPQAASRQRRFRPRLAAALALGLLAAVLAVPLLRAAAQEILARIGLITLTNEPTWAEQQARAWTPGPAATPVPLSPPGKGVSREAAAAAAGFHVYAPGPGYDFSSSSYAVLRNAEGLTEIVSIHSNPAVIRQSAPGEIVIPEAPWLMLSQAPAPPGGDLTRAVGDSPVREVTVRGRPGAWVERSPQSYVEIADPASGRSERRLLEQDLLLWEEDGFVFTLWLNGYSLEDATELADSLE